MHKWHRAYNELAREVSKARLRLRAPCACPGCEQCRLPLESAVEVAKRRKDLPIYHRIPDQQPEVSDAATGLEAAGQAQGELGCQITN